MTCTTINSWQGSFSEKKNSWQGLKGMLSQGQVGVHAELGVNQGVLVSL